MSILKRIKNLWEISSFVEEEKKELEKNLSDNKPKEKKLAKIISLEPDPIEQFNDVQTS